MRVLLFFVGLAGCAAMRTPAAVDVNVATVAELRTVPGLHADDPTRIAANRPYLAKDDLVRRGILDRDTYAAAEDRLVVGPPGTPEWLDRVPPLAQSP